MERNKAIVVFSGGQDSTTCLYWALRQFSEVHTITFTYGQKHSAEVEAARKIAGMAGVDFHLIDITSVASIGKNSLTDSSIGMDREKPAEGCPNTFVPGRNLFFISIAAVYARELGIHDIVTGVSQIHTPLMWIDKAQTWALADSLGVFDIVREHTLTCYNGIPGDGCGHCPACRLRNEGLKKYSNSRTLSGQSSADTF